MEKRLSIKIVKGSEDVARWHHYNIIYWCVNKLKGIVVIKSGIAYVKDRNGSTIRDKERVKKTSAEHFENVVNSDIVTGKYIEENEKVCDMMDVRCIVWWWYWLCGSLVS